jgi:hypothetical protein
VADTGNLSGSFNGGGVIAGVLPIMEHNRELLAEAQAALIASRRLLTLQANEIRRLSQLANAEEFL